MLMLKMAATYTVPSFLTHTFDEVSVWFFFCNFFIFIIFLATFFNILQNITLLTIQYRAQKRYVTYNNLLGTHY